MTRLKGKSKAKARKKKHQQKKLSAIAYKKRMLSMILEYDNEVLEKRCVELAVGSDVSKTISTMKKVLGCTGNGVGLAASQIGILERIIVVRPDAEEYEITPMINPEIISHSGEKKYGPEMCLSYPGVTGFVERYTSITVKYFDENWKECEVSYKEGDLELLIVQHEIDHLDGLCEIHIWWKDPEGMSKKLQAIFDKKYSKKEDASSCEIVESEDLKKEKEEAVVTAE